MARMKVKVCQWFILLFISLSVSVMAKKNMPKRKLTTTFLCPKDVTECPGPSKSFNGRMINFAHTTAVGDMDVLHYIITSVGTPAILQAKTGFNTTLNISWEKMSKNLSESVTFSEPPHYVFAVVMNRVLEYSDVDDHADLNYVSQDNKTWNIRHCSEMTWSESSLTTEADKHTISLKVDKDSKELHFNNNGSLEFKFEVHGTYGRQQELPSLAFTKDAAQVDFILDHVNATFDNSRFALEMAFATTSRNKSTVMEMITTKSIDDEHTPGVFELIDWVSHTKGKQGKSYLQWKPICYTMPKRTISVITRAKSYDIQHNISHSDLDYTVAHMFFGEKLFTSDVALSMTNVSFGLPKDKFYNLNKYNVWTAGIGKDAPPEDTVSTTIIIIIMCGVGIPVVLIIFGGIAVCIKKRRDRYKGYEDLSENDVSVNT